MPDRTKHKNGRRTLSYAVMPLLTALPLQAPPLARAGEAAGASSPVEEIYILRSLRETRVAPTNFCRVEAPTSEDNYSFHTASVSADNGLISDAKVKAVGNIHGCFGKTATAGVFSFAGDFETNGLAGKALGECRSGKTDFPETGLKLFSCYFDVSDLPAPYVGGQLTTNSLNSKIITGEASDPAGYMQVSIATIRLWKKRSE